MRFTKMQSSGNDYVYIMESEIRSTPPGKLAKFCSARRFGIGSDGMIVIGASEKCDIKMRVFNPDGSEAEMCGNALRSSAALVYMKGLLRKKHITVETLGGEKTVDILNEDGRYCRAVTDIGKPIGVKRVRLPYDIKGCFGEAYILSFGNPHCAIRAENVKKTALCKHGARLEKCSLFTNGANIHFYSVNDAGNIEARSWERGCGETFSCATGAAAVFAAARQNGECGKSAYVHHPGGELYIKEAENGHILITGETRIVYEGELSTGDVI